MKRILDIPESFFHRETRNDYTIEPVMKRIWAAQMELLATFDEGIRRIGAHYFTAYGTMLGAVRHQGFIPWDNDMDIFMLRDDYIRVERAAEVLFPELWMITCQNTSEWLNISGRLVTGTAIRLDDEYLDKYHGCPFDIGIDIFPLDTIPENPEEWSIQKQLVMMVAQAVAAYMQLQEPGETLLARRKQIEQVLNVQFDTSKPMTNQLLCLLDALLAMNDDQRDSELIGDIYKITYTNPVYKKDYFRQIIMQPFEGVMKVPVPIGYDEILRQHYGENYATPVEWKGYGDSHAFMAQIDLLKEHGYILDEDSGLFHKV